MNYVIDVADLFLARCPNITILSPTDFTIIAEWEKQEIPLTVVFNSIKAICDENGGEVGSISDLKDIVKQNYIDWLQTNESRHEVECSRLGGTVAVGGGEQS